MKLYESPKMKVSQHGSNLLIHDDEERIVILDNNLDTPGRAKRPATTLITSSRMIDGG